MDFKEQMDKLKPYKTHWEEICEFEHMNAEYIFELLGSITRELKTNSISKEYINEKLDEAKNHFNSIFDNYQRRKAG